MSWSARRTATRACAPGRRRRARTPGAPRAAQLDALADAEAAAAERSMQGARPLHDALADSLPLASLA